MQEFIVKAIEAGLKLVQTTREALAADLREIAEKIEGGALVADEAFDRAVATRDATKAARDNLPD